MKLLSVAELFNCTRAELFALHSANVAALARCAEGSDLQVIITTNLRRIRQVLADRTGPRS
jgi:hypothetical protein